VAAEGIAFGSGVSVGLGASVSSGVAVAGGDALGMGVGDLFLRFCFVSAVGVGDGVGELFFRFGEAVGDGLRADFFAADFRCFRAGVGVGVGSRIFLIFVPNDSSALPRATIVPKQIAAIRKLRRIILIAGNKINARVPEESLCSGECRLRDFQEGNSRSASARDNRGVRVPSGVSRYRECSGTARQSGCCRLRE
jgi:hypothetical protein